MIVKGKRMQKHIRKHRAIMMDSQTGKIEKKSRRIGNGGAYLDDTTYEEGLKKLNVKINGIKVSRRNKYRGGNHHMNKAMLQSVINEAKMREDKNYCLKLRSNKTHSQTQIWNNLTLRQQELIISITNMDDED